MSVMPEDIWIGSDSDLVLCAHCGATLYGPDQEHTKDHECVPMLKKWKPIETAPKDTWVLLGYTQQGDEMPFGLMVGVGKVHASGKIWTMNSWDNEKALPSHWRRLPDAP